MPEPLNHHEALFYVMVATSAVDRAMTDDEILLMDGLCEKLGASGQREMMVLNDPER
jgi:hypothetical protein